MTVLNTLLEITLYSGIIFIVTMLIKKAFRHKISPFLHFALWAIFLLRLIVPITLDAPVSLFTYQVTTAKTPVVSSDTLLRETSLGSVSVPDTQTREVTSVVTADADTPQNTKAISAPVSAPVFTPVQPLTTNEIVLIVWLGGVALGLGYVSLLAVLLARKVSRKSAHASANLQRLLADVKAELNINAKLKIVCQHEYGSPALLFPRTILMPFNKLAELDDEQIKNCLRHECMHYKRGDHLMSLLFTVLNAVYWFNPFMWLAYFEMRKDMETACDSAVVKHLEPCARRGYAELILSLSSQTRHMQFALGMAQSRKNAERRIKGVFMAQKTKRGVKLISALLAALLMFSCFTTACQPTPAKPVVVNKSGGITGAMVADPLPPGAVKE